MGSVFSQAVHEGQGGRNQAIFAEFSLTNRAAAWIFTLCARDRRYRTACSEETRQTLTACCPSHRLKQAASITFRRRWGTRIPPRAPTSQNSQFAPTVDLPLSGRERHHCRQYTS